LPTINRLAKREPTLKEALDPGCVDDGRAIANDVCHPQRQKISRLAAHLMKVARKFFVLPGVSSSGEAVPRPEIRGAVSNKIA
jgi:hypothetical protein